MKEILISFLPQIFPTAVVFPSADTIAPVVFPPADTLAPSVGGVSGESTDSESAIVSK